MSRPCPERRRLLTAALTGPALLLMSSPAEAWLQRPKPLLNRVARALRSQPELQATFSGQAVVEGRAVPIGARWIFSQGNRSARVDVNGRARAQATWVRPDQISGQKSLLPPQLMRLVLTRLFADADPMALAADLQVDLTRQRLRLMRNQPTQVIGEAAGEPSDFTRPRLWIDPDTALIKRVSMGIQGQRVAVDLDRWDTPPGAGIFPGRIRLRVGRAWMRQEETQQVRTRAPGAARG